jgi:hypothetical protein
MTGITSFFSGPRTQRPVALDALSTCRRCRSVLRPRPSPPTPPNATQRHPTPPNAPGHRHASTAAAFITYYTLINKPRFLLMPAANAPRAHSGVEPRIRGLSCARGARPPPSFSAKKAFPRRFMNSVAH